MSKKLAHMFMATILIFSMFFQSVTVLYASSMDGEGTAESPYLIKTVDDFYKIADNTAAYYKLVNNIDFTNTERQPIANFTGTLDGAGFKIYNLNIVGDRNVGLFGTLAGATIENITIDKALITSSIEQAGTLYGSASDSTFKNCRITNSTVNGGNYSGVLGGYDSAGNFENCFVFDGKVIGKDYIGGMLGFASGSKLNKCYAKSAVEGNEFNGGMIGGTANVSLEQCAAEGTVEAVNFAGGLMGYSNVLIKIHNSYSKSTITARKGAGLVGDRSFSLTLDIANSYYSGEINSTTKAGLSDIAVDTNTSNSYFDGTLTEIATPESQSRTTEQMYNKDNYVDWDFDSIWSIDNGKDYPVLRFISESNPEEPGGQTRQLKVVLEPMEQLQLSVDEDLSENTKMSWSSSDPSVATVAANGVVTAIKKGNTIITVVSEDGTYTEKINVLVVDDAKEYRLAIDLKVGEKCRLTIDDAEDLIGTWTVMDSSVATITNKGRVTAVAKGLTIVTAFDEDGNEVGQVYIRVR